MLYFLLNIQSFFTIFLSLLEKLGGSRLPFKQDESPGTTSKSLTEVPGLVDACYISIIYRREKGGSTKRI